MKRRNFVSASVSTVLSGVATSSLQRPAVGLNFEISEPYKDPSKVNSLSLYFETLEITPRYLDGSDPITVQAEIETNKYGTAESNKHDITFENGVTEELSEKINPMVIDEIDADSEISGSVTVKVKHPNIEEAYIQDFGISDIRIPNSAESYWSLSSGSGTTFNDELSSVNGDIADAEWVNDDAYEKEYALEWNTDGGGDATNTNQYGDYIRGHTDPFSIGVTVEKFAQTELSPETIWSVGGDTPNGSASDIKLSCGFEDGYVGWGSRDDVILRRAPEPEPPYKSRFLCTWDGSTARFYIDGVEKTDDSGGRITNTSTKGDLTIGSQIDRTRNLKTGRITSATFYKKAVSPSTDS